MTTEVPVLDGRTCVVTGANRGVGLATATGLARLGARVVLVCRDPDRGEAARDEVRRRAQAGDVDLKLADLSSLRSVRALAADLAGSPLHVLVNNAALIPRERSVTEDGIETQLAVNHLAPFLLTNLLLDTLRASAPSRVVNVSSMAHAGAAIDFDDLQSEGRYDPTEVYGRTKLANLLFTSELARRLEGTGVTANALHPGIVATRLLVDYGNRPRWLRRLVAAILGTSPERGARTSIHVASSPELAGVSGEYFVRCRPAVPSAAARDRDAAARLWEVSAELTGLAPEAQARAASEA